MQSWRPDPPGREAGRIGQIATTSYISTGVTSPITAGVYFWNGSYDAHEVYMCITNGMFIWWYAPESKWKINTVVGTPGGAYFTSPTTAIVGTYVPGGTATGNPVVTAAP
jgi:hypothetical protein